MTYRRRRFTALLVLTLIALGGLAADVVRSEPPPPVINGNVKAVEPSQVQQEVQTKPDSTLAGNLLETIPVKGRSPKTGYKRTQYGNGWAELGNCDVRNHILARDLANVVFRSESDCTVLSGTMESDPYTGLKIDFVRGPDTSAVIQIDHIVALSDSWQKGTQQLTFERRQQLANDPLNLLAADGPANNKKGDADAASWLPPNKDYRCRYVARQVAVKKKYDLWVTEAERDAMRKVLATCPEQAVPIVGE